MNKDVPVSPQRHRRQDAFWGWMDRKVRDMVASAIEKVFEFQQDADLAALWNERTASRRGYRNGHYRRKLLTPHGSLSVQVPRCRDGSANRSLVFDRYQRRISDVDRIIRHAYLLGSSTRGTAELAEQVFGDTVSHQTVSRLMRWLDEAVARWRCQPISPDYKVVYIDGMHVDVLGGDRMVMLVCGQREAQGGLEVLDFCVSTGERCRKLLADLRRRGLENVELFVSDESGPIRSALEEVYPEVPWQSCTFHRLKNLRDNVGPTDFRDLMLAEAACLFRCPSRLAAYDAAVAWTRRWRSDSPWAVQQFVNGLSDSLTFYSLPKEWWSRARTNNPLERLIETLRMRLNNMGCFHDDAAIERAIFGQLLRWRKIKLTHSS